MNRALIIVDVQNDFCEEGSLPVVGGAAVAKAISDYLEYTHDAYDLIVASKDFHDGHSTNEGHFSEDPDFVDTWPRHCVGDTHGSNFHRNFDTTLVQVVVYKGSGVPAYSALEGFTSKGKALTEVLKESNIQGVDVCGIATDYCVKATVMGALDAGFSTRLLLDLTAAVGGDRAKEDTEMVLTAAGASVVKG